MTLKELEHKQLKGRLMGKFFGIGKEKEKKPSSEEEVSDFLYGPTNKLHTASSTAASNTPPRPPVLGRIDTSTARRWPTAAEVNNDRRNGSASPKRSRKGLVVRFTEAQPEVIGEGGDECASPSAYIAEALRNRSATSPQKQNQRPGPPPANGSQGPADKFREPDTFRPGPLQHTQPAFPTISDQDSALDNEPSQPYRNQRNEASYNGNARTGSHSSFTSRAEAAMRASEGKALVRAVSGHFEERDLALAALTANENSPPREGVHLNAMKNTQLSSSPGIPMNPFGRPETPSDSEKSNLTVAEESPSSFSRTVASKSASAVDTPPPPYRAPAFDLKDVAMAVGEDALIDFARRTSHLFTLFRLSAESLKSLSSCSLEELVRSALWWFLKGRCELESSIRDRAKQNSFVVRQQSYSNLAKAYWLMEKIASQCPEMMNQRNADTPHNTLDDTLEARQAILSGLKKLTMVRIDENMVN
ncbi:hypothetical protein NHQ30_000512 [Ciborinia camelliae]|nr:hypothetical protein NHQ30_000512 [Ciborinia camelliae]